MGLGGTRYLLQSCDELIGCLVWDKADTDIANGRAGDDRETGWSKSVACIWHARGAVTSTYVHNAQSGSTPPGIQDGPAYTELW